MQIDERWMRELTSLQRVNITSVQQKKNSDKKGEFKHSQYPEASDFQ